MKALPGWAWLAGLCVLVSSAPAAAHWTDHPELPDWARRGYVQWGHGANIDGRIKWAPGGFGADLPNVKLILSTGCNLQQTLSYLDPEAERIGREGDLRRQPYICSQTIWWEREFRDAPQLANAVRLMPDGSHTIMYSNPQRYPGCYSNPVYLEYMKKRIRDTFTGGGGKVDSIFFDNPAPYECYCPLCREGFRRYTQEKYGVAMDASRPKEYPEFRLAKSLFDLDTTCEFFAKVREYVRTFDKDAVISPNIGVGSGVAAYLVTHGCTDILFCEEGFTLPPFQTTTIGYKLGLAATHGMATGQLLGLPEHLRRVRALSLDASNEMGILESFVYPEEHQLAMAEALACDGTYILSFALREQKICTDDAPHHAAVRQALQQYAAFTKRHLGLYDRARPGSRIAVLNSVWTELVDRSAARALFTDACTALARAGLPYEVIVEDDLKPALLASYRLVVLPAVRSLSVEDSGALLAFARSGGALVQIGPVAMRDRLARAYAPDALPELARLPAGEVQVLGRGRLSRPPVERLGDLKPDELAGLVGKLADGLECRVAAGSGKVFANLLRTADGKRLGVHLVNSDFVYDDRASADVRDDSGTLGARTFLARTDTRARKTLLVPDPAALRGSAVRFLGGACGLATDRFSVVVSLNGRDLKSYKGNELLDTQWHQVAIPEGLLRKENEVVFRAEGSPNGHPDWFGLKIDTAAATRRSSWSSNGGKTWFEADLSPDTGIQTGEYLVRIGPLQDPDAVAKPEDFAGRLHVRPAKDVAVTVKVSGRAPAATLVSPDGGERAVLPKVAGGLATYRVTEVRIYSVLVLQ